MTSSRFTPLRLRARYLKTFQTRTAPTPDATLDTAPDAAPSPATAPPDLACPPDPARLTVLGRENILGRGVHFGTLASAPRLWAALTDADEPLLGYVTGLVENEPELLACDGPHRAWVGDAATVRELERAAVSVWRSCLRHCEG